MREQEKQAYIVGSKSFTAVAVNAASKAGEWIQSKLGGYNDLQFKRSSADLVTEVDKGAEQMIRQLIATHFPEHDFLGEESAVGGLTIEQAKKAEYCWIVDPIDGTTNFVHGLPMFSVSIALAHRGELIAGVIYDPSRDEMFVAEKGKGAYLHGHKMQVSGDLELRSSLLAGGFPANEEAIVNAQSMLKLIPKVRNVRVVGSAALHLAYVAAGRLSGYWEYGLSIWDIAAGVLLIQESGGKVTDSAGEPFALEVRNLVATNGPIHDELIRELNE